MLYGVRNKKTKKIVFFYTKKRMFARHNLYIKLLAQGLYFLQYIIFTLKEVKKRIAQVLTFQGENLALLRNFPSNLK